MIVAVMFRSWKIWSRLPYLKWRDLLMYCASLGLMNILFYTSLGKLPQGIAVGLEFIGPLGLALVSIKQKSDYIWVAFAMLGIALMVPWQDPTQHHFSYVGAACALGAGLCWAFCLVNIFIEHSPKSIYFLTLTTLTVSSCIFLLWQPKLPILE
ncbi:DMT family transporter [Acinetobacter baumannii]